MTSLFSRTAATIKSPTVCATNHDPLVTDDGRLAFVIITNTPGNPGTPQGHSAGTVKYTNPAVSPMLGLGITASGITGFNLTIIHQGVLSNWSGAYIPHTSPIWVAVSFNANTLDSTYISPAALTP